MEKYIHEVTPDLDFFPYYKAQAGSGIANGHGGDRYHVGNGIWGTVLSYLPKALKYISRFGISGLKNFGNEILEGKPLSEAGTNALTTTAQDILDDANAKLKKYKTGGGRKRVAKRKPARKKAKKPKRKPAKRKSTKKSAKTKKKLYKTKIVSGNYI